MNLNRPKIRFAVPTDDLKGSLKFYETVLQLEMRPFSNAILMFPFGDAQLEVCQRSEAKGLLWHEFGDGKAKNLHVSMLVEGSHQLSEIASSLERYGLRVVRDKDHPNSIQFTDLNGLNWLLEGSEEKIA